MPDPTTTATPDVSVLLACYNPRWLEQSMRSVLTQDHENLELLILDDSNSPAVRATVAEFNDPRVRYFGNPKPLGPAGNHSLGIAQARAPYIGIVNHDDLWKPTLVSRLLAELAQNPDAVVAFSRHECIDEFGRVDAELAHQMDRTYGRADLTPGPHRPFVHLAVSRQAIPVAQSAIWAKSACPQIPARIYGAYDWWVGYRLSRGGGAAVYCDAELAQWRVHAGNLTSSFSLRKQLGSLWAIRDMLADDAVRSEKPALQVRYRRIPRHFVGALVRDLRGKAHRSGPQLAHSTGPGR